MQINTPNLINHFKTLLVKLKRWNKFGLDKLQSFVCIQLNPQPISENTLLFGVLEKAMIKDLETFLTLYTLVIKTQWLSKTASQHKMKITSFSNMNQREMKEWSLFHGTLRKTEKKLISFQDLTTLLLVTSMESTQREVTFAFRITLLTWTTHCQFLSLD